MTPQNEKKSRILNGRVAEWPIASVLKTEVLHGTGGSNPSSSENNTPFGVFFFAGKGEGENPGSPRSEARVMTFL